MKSRCIRLEEILSQEETDELSNFPLTIGKLSSCSTARKNIQSSKPSSKGKENVSPGFESTYNKSHHTSPNLHVRSSISELFTQFLFYFYILRVQY